ncbi:MAG: hypothetical protein ACLU38_01130 [Dysosmobacter sp.]
MDRQTLAQEITQYLTEQGAARVGFADLHGVTGASLPYGITALVALPREIVGPLVDQPHRAYYDAYQAINVRLDAMAEGQCRPAADPWLSGHGQHGGASAHRC